MTEQPGMTSDEGRVTMTPDMFPCSLRARMIHAYPVIARLSRDEAYLATVEEKDEAFARLLAAKNLRPTFEMWLRDNGVTR